MEPCNFSSDSFSKASAESKLVLFKPEKSYSQIVDTAKLRRGRISWFDRLLQSLLNTLGGRSEIRISEKRDRAGNSYFQVFDPVSGTSQRFGSEHEVRVWLDQRYSQ